MRTTVSSRSEVTQTAPSPAATPAGTNGSGILAASLFVAGSRRQSSRPSASPATHRDPLAERETVDRLVRGGEARPVGWDGNLRDGVRALELGLELAHNVSRGVGEPDGAVAGRDPQRADVVLGTERGDEAHVPIRVERCDALLGAVRDQHFTPSGRDVGGTSARRDTQHILRPRVDPPDVPVAEARHPHTTAVDGDRSRRAPDGNRLADRVRLRVDADERVGAGLSLRCSVAAGEEEREQGGADQSDTDNGDGERPAAAFRFGDPERPARASSISSPPVW